MHVACLGTKEGYSSFANQADGRTGNPRKVQFTQASYPCSRFQLWKLYLDRARPDPWVHIYTFDSIQDILQLSSIWRWMCLDSLSGGDSWWNFKRTEAETKRNRDFYPLLEHQGKGHMKIQWEGKDSLSRIKSVIRSVLDFLSPSRPMFKTLSYCYSVLAFYSQRTSVH